MRKAFVALGSAVLLCAITPTAGEEAHNHPVPEKLGAGLLIFATFAIGVYPKVLLDRIIPAVEAMRFLK